MSNTLAIGAATATLRNLLQKGIDHDGGNLRVTTLPPDKTQTFSQNDGDGRINLFLYQTQWNATWRNMDIPRQVRPGETGNPPLALDLFYLLTAQERTDGDSNVFAHRLLGRAMRVLHDHPVLGADEIRQALQDNDLADQLERIRITPQPLSVDEISKLWMVFQSAYRISAAYQVSLVLIDSLRASRTPLPVLARGRDDTGAKAQANLIPPFPTLTGVKPSVQPPDSRTSVLLGDNLGLDGHDLDGANVSAQVSHPRLADPVPLPPPLNTSATAITVNLPSQPGKYPAGILTISVSMTRPGETFARTSNALPFALAPQIAAAPPINAVRNGNQVTISLTCEPMVLPAQRVSLLLGGDEISAQPVANPTSQLSFVATDDPPGKFPPGSYYVRLRVDGVDSLLVDQTVQPPTFDPTQKVQIP